MSESPQQGEQKCGFIIIRDVKFVFFLEFELCKIRIHIQIRFVVPARMIIRTFGRAVTVPLIPFPVRFGSVFEQKPWFRFGSVFSYLLTIFGHFKS